MALHSRWGERYMYRNNYRRTWYEICSADCRLHHSSFSRLPEPLQPVDIWVVIKKNISACLDSHRASSPLSLPACYRCSHDKYHQLVHFPFILVFLIIVLPSKGPGASLLPLHWVPAMEMLSTGCQGCSFHCCPSGPTPRCGNVLCSMMEPKATSFVTWGASWPSDCRNFGVLASPCFGHDFFLLQSLLLGQLLHSRHCDRHDVCYYDTVQI